jgi:mitogen-activated protein kinase kinase
MSALLRSQALGGGLSTTGPASGPLSLAARRGGPGAMQRPSMAGGMSAPGGMGMNRPMGGPSGMGARRMGPPGGLTLSGMQGGAAKAQDNKFTDFGKIMYVHLPVQRSLW